LPTVSLMEVLTALIALATASYVVATILLWRESNRTRKTLNKELEMLQRTAQINAYIFLIPYYQEPSSPAYNQVLANEYALDLTDILESIKKDQL